MANVTQNIDKNISSSSSNEEELRNAQTNTFLSGTPPQYEFGEPQVQVIDNKIVIKQITFPQRLMKLLSHEEYADIASWLPHGQSFLIYDKTKFEDIVLPRFFKGTKFTSFTRKLNRWRFERITKGIETGAYKHESFQRDNAALCNKMTCQKKYEIKKRNFDEIPENPTKDLSFVTDIIKSKAEEKDTGSIVNNPEIKQNSKPNHSGAGDQATLMHLLQLRQQQREIEERLEQVVHSAFEQARLNDSNSLQACHAERMKMAEHQKL